MNRKLEPDCSSPQLLEHFNIFQVMVWYYKTFTANSFFSDGRQLFSVNGQFAVGAWQQTDRVSNW